MLSLAFIFVVETLHGIWQFADVETTKTDEVHRHCDGKFAELQFDDFPSSCAFLQTKIFAAPFLRSVLHVVI